MILVMDIFVCVIHVYTCYHCEIYYDSDNGVTAHISKCKTKMAH